jgi:NTP pyrophosphatase (non-canonical NTP hydrolase)
MADYTLEEWHATMVRALVKDPSRILDTLNTAQTDMIHAVLGIAGETGELVDAIKKMAIYNKPLDMENVIEEMGDIEFYMAQLRDRLMITRETVLAANIAKLNKRYAGGTYTDQAAQDRADKASERMSQAYQAERGELHDKSDPKPGDVGYAWPSASDPLGRGLDLEDPLNHGHKPHIGE